MSEFRRNVRILRRATADSEKKESEANTSKEVAKTHPYDFYDSPISSYEESFANIIVPFLDLNSFLVNYFKDKKRLVGIELGGPGTALFSGFEEGLFSKTAGFTLKSFPDHNTGRGHTSVEADVFLKEIKYLSWHMVQEWIEKNGRPDFIIERMVGPLHMIRSVDLFVLILKRWVNILNQGGIMLIQTPPENEDFNLENPKTFYEDLKEKLGVKSIVYKTDKLMLNFGVLKIEK